MNGSIEKEFMNLIKKMAQKDRELILKDLCARLPHRVKVAFEEDGNLITDTITMIGWPSNEVMLYEASEFFRIEEIKPYLRPMSSMTEEEEVYYDTVFTRLKFWQKVDWLNEHHFDFRGLIDKGLALEAPKDMYNV